MHHSDTVLERIVRDWAASQYASVAAEPEAKGAPATVHVQPENAASIPVRLWISDDGDHVAVSIGGGSWWDRAVPLDKRHVEELLSAVASCKAGEEVKEVGRLVVQRRGYIQLLSGRLEYGQLLWVPIVRWQKVRYEPY